MAGIIREPACPAADGIVAPMPARRLGTLPGAIRPLPAFGCILLLTVAVRLPFLFPAVLDWDESTFILVGQSVLDGHLPYVRLWDLKPPLLFGFFAAAIAAFGHSIPGIRLAGALCVATTSWLVLLVAARWWGRTAGWLAALLCLLETSLIGSGQATMSEHVMLPALMGSLYLMLGEERSDARSFLAGALMAAASLVRSNVVYAALAGALACTRGIRSAGGMARALVAYSLGGFAVVALTCLPYAVAGRLPLLWQSAVEAAFVRSGSVDTIGERAMALLLAAFHDGRGSPGLSDALRLDSFLWLGALAGLALTWRTVRRREATAPRGLAATGLVAAATGASIAMSGGTYPHYLIQLVPFAALFAAALVRLPPPAVRTTMLVLVAALACRSLRPVVEEYRAMVSRAASGRQLRHGTAFRVAAYLRDENPSGEPVLLLAAHLAHWLGGTYPPTPFAAHPSTLFRQEVLASMGTSTPRELRAIFDRRPAFVVVDWKAPFLRGGNSALLASTLAGGYLPSKELDGLAIYRRRVE